MSIFITPGEQPLSVIQATKRGEQVLHKELSAAGARAGDEAIFYSTPHEGLPSRLLIVLAALPGAPTTYSDYAAQWEVDNQTNGLNNLFNHQLAGYHKAMARLAQYRLADGRAEVTEQVETGEFDEDGQPITEPVVTASFIEALPATVEQTTYDDMGESTSVEQVPNPEIVKDDAERAAAQAVVDSMPQAVKDFF